MYLEEKIINGILHYRNSPNDEFKPYPIEIISHLYEHQKKSYYRLLDKIKRIAIEFDNAKDDNRVIGNYTRLDKLVDELINRLKAL